MSKTDLNDLGLGNPTPMTPDLLSSLDGLESLPAEAAALPEPPPLAAPEFPATAPALAEAPAEPAKESKKEKKRKARAAKQAVPSQAGDSLLDRLKQASPYQVLLAVSAAMIFIAIVCMVLELGTYGFALKP